MTTQTNDTPFRDSYNNTDYIAVDIQPLGTFQVYQWLMCENDTWQVSLRSVYGPSVSLVYTMTLWDLTAQGLELLGLDPLRMQNVGWSYRGQVAGVSAEF